MNTMTKIPHISAAIQSEHTGESAAIVDGQIVAFGKNSWEAEQSAITKGYRPQDIMTAFIMGKENYAL